MAAIASILVVFGVIFLAELMFRAPFFIAGMAIELVVTLVKKGIKSLWRFLTCRLFSRKERK